VPRFEVRDTSRHPPHQLRKQRDTTRVLSNTAKAERRLSGSSGNGPGRLRTCRSRMTRSRPCLRTVRRCSGVRRQTPFQQRQAFVVARFVATVKKAACQSFRQAQIERSAMNSTSGIDRRTLSAAMAGTALATGCTTATNGHMNAAWLRGQDEAEHLRTILGTPALGCGIESRYCPNIVAAGNRMKGASVAVTAQDRRHWGVNYQGNDGHADCCGSQAVLRCNDMRPSNVRLPVHTMTMALAIMRESRFWLKSGVVRAAGALRGTKKVAAMAV
jgi:hypothetical protein